MTCKRGFSEHKSMYQKQKITSTPQVDMEELKRQLRKEVLGDLRPILEAKGIQFPDIGGVMSDEEHRSSLASIAGGGRPRGDPPPPSIELDTIDNLAQLITCSLISLVGGSF
jgi:hypothetical protein